MSIAVSELITNFVQVDPFAGVQYVRDEVGDDVWKYIVVDRGGGNYAVFQLAHLIDRLQAWKGNAASASGASLDQIPGMLDGFTAAAIDINSDVSTAQAKKTAIKAPLKVVVCTDGGKVAGVFNPKSDIRSGDIPNVDFNALPAGATAAAAPGVLSASEEAAPAKTYEPRFVNIELLNDDYEKLNPEEKPLAVTTTYTLSFFIDQVVSEFSIGGSVDIGDKIFADTDEDEVVLQIQLESEDVEIDNNIQDLRVPRTGKSKKARFDFKTKGEGEATIQAIILKDGAFVQVITLKFFVGKLFKTETLGREIDAVSLIRPRNVTLTILNQGPNFQIIMSGATAAIATLPLDKRYLASLVAKLRKTLLDVVHLKASGVNIYQTRTDIPEGVNQHVLPILANAGYDLFDQIFYGPSADMQANLMGDTFKKMAKGDKLNIQIFSQEFTLPWGLIYVGDDPDEPEPEMFLGLKHVIEHIPLQPKMQVTERSIDTSKGLSVGLNFNRDIDAQMGTEIIGRQEAYWKELMGKNGAIKVDVRASAADVMEPLNDGETKDDILYFYCHAESYDLTEADKGGPDHSRLIMTGHEELTLRKISRNKTSFAGQPLVFINACESAEMSPEFYDGFVPYFVSKGARGVIGTECETPAIFAEEWANRFFKRFLGSDKSLGDIFLELRREFYFKHNNLMGLVYALYVDGDTYLSQPLLEAEA